MKENSAFHKGHSNLTHRVFSVIYQDTRWWDSNLFREAVGVLYSPSLEVVIITLINVIEGADEEDYTLSKYEIRADYLNKDLFL